MNDRHYPLRHPEADECYSVDGGVRFDEINKAGVQCKSLLTRHFTNHENHVGSRMFQSKRFDGGIFPMMRDLSSPLNANDNVEQSLSQSVITVEDDREQLG